MLTLLSTMILRSMKEQSTYPDHLKDHADRYVRSPQLRREQLLPFRSLW